MGDEGLILNITHTPITSYLKKDNSKFSGARKSKGNRISKALKRKSEDTNAGPLFKRPTPAPSSRIPPKPSKAKATEGSNKKGNKEKKEDTSKGKPSVKTSSLFKNNPNVPDIERPKVKQLQEEVFSLDSFSELGLHPHLVSTINTVMNMTHMTSVQKLTIPALLSGKDAMVRSQTGSGKTLAYGIPVVQSLQGATPKIQRSDGPYALVLVPTRELALQSFNTIQKLLKPFTWIVPGVLMGGEKRKSEKARLRKGINILISTPGRLLDHIKFTKSIHFARVRWLIVDEADRILDLGFEKDITAILNAVNSQCQERQNVLLSATLSQGVTRLADISLHDPFSVTVTDDAQCENKLTVKPESVEATGEISSFAMPEQLCQHAVVVPSKLKLVTLAAFLMEKWKCARKPKMIVFFASCELVEFYFTLFCKVLTPMHSKKDPLVFLRLHGNMKQESVHVVRDDVQVLTRESVWPRGRHPVGGQGGLVGVAEGGGVPCVLVLRGGRAVCRCSPCLVCICVLEYGVVSRLCSGYVIGASAHSRGALFAGAVLLGGPIFRELCDVVWGSVVCLGELVVLLGLVGSRGGYPLPAVLHSPLTFPKLVVLDRPRVGVLAVVFLSLPPPFLPPLPFASFIPVYPFSPPFPPCLPPPPSICVHTVVCFLTQCLRSPCPSPHSLPRSLPPSPLPPSSLCTRFLPLSPPASPLPLQSVCILSSVSSLSACVAHALPPTPFPVPSLPPLV
ncbi:probable ATP-dependent RNA helicase DDX31 [Pelobates cultripes]|uniref:ATP-dependent RNA helicase n=1 Tax=Pelobates cultripes TaxID=61616 RepID=A0AAD1T3N3_PELCU|nr:probable ATP-dependent RNA helicase DDX31 [Pelobates cultripes]